MSRVSHLARGVIAFGSFNASASIYMQVHIISQSERESAACWSDRMDLVQPRPMSAFKFFGDGASRASHARHRREFRGSLRAAQNPCRRTGAACPYESQKLNRLYLTPNPTPVAAAKLARDRSRRRGKGAGSPGDARQEWPRQKKPTARLRLLICRLALAFGRRVVIERAWTPKHPWSRIRKMERSYRDGCQRGAVR